jgi:pilus assembly protein Flp/PilA
MLTKFFAQMQNKVQDEEGQGLVEYVLIIALIALVVAVTMPTVTDAIAALFDRIATALA